MIKKKKKNSKKREKGKGEKKEEIINGVMENVIWEFETLFSVFSFLRKKKRGKNKKLKTKTDMFILKSYGKRDLGI